MSSIISITQIIKTSTNVTLSAVSGKIQRVVNTGASSITVTYGSSTFSLPAGKFADFWYENSAWRVSDSNLVSASAPTFTGLLDISSSGAGQIKFPATQNPSSDPNTLDDYEEGTWSPNVIGTSGGTASGTFIGKYRKFGNRVTVSVKAVITSFTGMSGNLRINNLPFICSDNSYPVAAVYTESYTYITGYQIFAYAMNTLNIINFYCTASGDISRDCPVDSNFIMNFTIEYNS